MLLVQLSSLEALRGESLERHALTGSDGGERLELRVATGGCCVWLLSVVVLCGCCVWLLRVVVVCGSCVWLLRVVVVCGCCVW